MVGILPKGSLLEEVTPYATIPLCHDDDDARFDSEGFEAALRGLPGWTGCPIWEQQSQHLPSSGPLRKCLRRARRRREDPQAASWHALCLWTLLRIVADHHHHEPPTNPPWWASLLRHDDDDDRTEDTPGGGSRFSTDDDDEALLAELWPPIRDRLPSWKACQRLYRRIQARLHVLTLPHPLTAWAQTTLPGLTEAGFEAAQTVFGSLTTKGVSDTPSSPMNRLRASKLWLDLASGLPERCVGVLLSDPLLLLEQQHRTPLTRPAGFQSCLPNTCLELHAAPADSVTAVSCRWIALYDLSPRESSEPWTLSTMPRSDRCDCFRCVYEGQQPKETTGRKGTKRRRNPVPTEIHAANLEQARRLAHAYFFEQSLDQALSLYQRCHEFCSSPNHLEPAAAARAHARADLWHTLGAVRLSQQRFAAAQEHWKNGDHYASIHHELSEQLAKQTAYQYFDPLPPEDAGPCGSYETLRRLDDAAAHHVFVASRVLEASTGGKLVEWANDHAAHHGGWTASRHYAVPTTDLPVHGVPKLLAWFRRWMPRVLLPLLRHQFAVCENDDRFYVHDAFVVRYEAVTTTASAGGFLPLHFDESTHSCVIALNDDFEGGGTYLYDHDRSIDLEPGAMVSFRGDRCFHGGTPVTRGVRYILAIFLYLDRDLAKDPGASGNHRGGRPIGTSRANGTRDDKDSKLSKRFKTKDNNTTPENGAGGFSFSFF